MMTNVIFFYSFLRRLSLSTLQAFFLLLETSEINSIVRVILIE